MASNYTVSKIKDKDGNIYNLLDASAIHGSGTTNYLAKFTAEGTIGNAGDIAIGSDTTKFLRNDGTWATPSGTFSLAVATYTTLGGVKPFKSYSGAASGITASSGTTAPAVNALSTTTGRYYAVEIDKDGRLFVNVPWAANTDEKVKVEAIAATTATAYYPILATDTGTATRQIDKTGLFKYTVKIGTASAAGSASLSIGNAISTGTNNNVEGSLVIFGSVSYGTTIKHYGSANSGTAYLPQFTSSATSIYLVGTLDSGDVGSETTPVYVSDGIITESTDVINTAGITRWSKVAITNNNGTAAISGSNILNGPCNKNDIVIDTNGWMYRVTSAGTDVGGTYLGKFEPVKLSIATTTTTNDTLLISGYSWTAA